MTNDTIISVSNLSKCFQIGRKKNTYDNASELISKTISRSLKKIFKPFVKSDNQQNSDFEDLWALNNVSFEIKKGEAVGIIGHNGSGKSTLLKVLSRITMPTSGEAIIYGRVGSLLEVGTGFHPELTGRENIFLNGSILGMSRFEIKSKFDEIIDFAEIEKFLDTPVKHYSSGMYVRLAFSVAAHLEPEILIVDEILAVGDVRFQKKCLGKMGDVTQSGRTVIFVSHNMPAVRALCTKGILLNHGKMQHIGPINEVLHHYLNDMSASSIYRQWALDDRPRNHAIQLISIGITDINGEQKNNLYLSEDFFVTIQYEITENNTQAGFTILLYNEDGVAIFNSLSNQEKSYYGKPMSKGIYKTTCRLPGHLLNDIQYYITLYTYCANWSDTFVLDRVITFEGIDDGVLKGDYHGQFGGLVRPKLDWQTMKI